MSSHNAPLNAAHSDASSPDDSPLEAALRTDLERFAAHERVLIALDFDGTLAPEVDDPAAARSLPEARNALLRLIASRGTTVALVSGRSLDSLAAVGDMPDEVPLIGSHGLELRLGVGDDRAAVDDADRARVLTLRSWLEPIVAATEGAWIEHKPAGFAVHTRLIDLQRASELQTAVRAAARATDGELTVREGKNVIEFAVRDATKGDGLRALRARFTPDAVLFAGDDVTDEDALATLAAGDLGVKVGTADTVATHRVADPWAIAALLTALADLRGV